MSVLSADRTVALILFVTGVGWGGGALAGPATPSASGPFEVISALRERENRISSLEIEWLDERNAVLQTSPHADRDVKLDNRRILLLQGRAWRYEQEGDIFHASLGRAMTGRRVTVADGAQSRRFLALDGRPQTGTIGAPDSPGTWIELLAPSLAFRPITWLFIDAARCSLVDAETTLGDRHCVLLREALQPGAERYYWIDPSRDHAILRFEKKNGGRTSIRVDIDYGRYDATAYAPTGWKITRVDADTAKLLGTYAAKVTRCKLNSKIDTAAFQLRFPVGTLVTDNRKGQEYFVRDGGEKRAVLKSELARGATPEDLMNTEPGMAARPARGRSFAGFALILASVACVVGATWLVLQAARAQIGR